jgi:hypothetical protein
MIIIYVNVALYIFSIFLDPQGIFGGSGPFGILAPSNQSLFLLGASGTFPVIGAHRFWTLISASFLHGGIFHILFNMMALYQLGPFIIREFGVHRFINQYIVTRICGIFPSVISGTPFTIGSLHDLRTDRESFTTKSRGIPTEKPFTSRPCAGSSPGHFRSEFSEVSTTGSCRRTALVYRFSFLWGTKTISRKPHGNKIWLRLYPAHAAFYMVGCQLAFIA